MRQQSRVPFDAFFIFDHPEEMEKTDFFSEKNYLSNFPKNPWKKLCFFANFVSRPTIRIKQICSDKF